MFNRRRFLQSVAAAAIAPALLISCDSRWNGIPRLKADPNKLIDIPDGFSYTVVSRRGDPMADGLHVPGAHDGMAAFEGEKRQNHSGLQP